MAKLAQLRWYVRRNARCWEIRKFQCAKPFRGEERGDSTRVQYRMTQQMEGSRSHQRRNRGHSNERGRPGNGRLASSGQWKLPVGQNR